MPRCPLLSCPSPKRKRGILTKSLAYASGSDRTATGSVENRSLAMTALSPQRTLSVARKELLHILRDPQTLLFTLIFPIMELFILGYAIDLNVRHVRTVIYDEAGTQESRQLLQRFENSQDFDITARGIND